ncbi:LysR substrate-binding domain-containing protein [Modestobacter sp. DSM 44400]|uniref:LysR substrate-binding domain-containing protein n=1 Tax=Modestobacter sp. DSM 44400 TaxID=1550230 RepID=UPI0020C86A68|nr:LysR substrate-binding domain-containing protein [Modestobacter sp. DSM 44400]
MTAHAEPVPGCSSTRLGGMRYRPMATPAFLARWLPDGVTPAALAGAPVVVYDRDDNLQHGWLRKRAGPAADPPQHFLPSSADYVTAVRLGLGWGMVPDLQRTPADAGRLRELDPDGAVDVILYWQQWRLRSPSLDRVAAAVLSAARKELDRDVGP